MSRPTAHLLAGFLRLLAMALLVLAGLPARADTPVSLFQSFRGNVNFVGTEESLRTRDNNKACTLANKGRISATLSGIPGGATIVSAQLYWAASGAAADYTVTFDGVEITAPPTRQYAAKAYANKTSYAYFSGAADVTSQVANKGNGTYTFSGLTVDNGSPWCDVQGVVGGFALAVVYSHPNEPFRLLNLYEGFQPFQNTSLSIDLGNFNVPDPLPSTVTGRIGHITWEGDSTLSQGGEDLLFNGVEMTDAINPKGNQFNSASNVTGDTSSYGIDFDIYTLTSPTIQPGQRTATTTYKSGPDMVLLSAELVAMPYVANADLSLAMTRTGDLTVGSSTSYALTVANGGVDDEMGPVTVVDTLPAGLKLVSAGGSGWTCTNAQSSGQTVVTCTQAGPLKPGAKMPALIIAVSPTAPGNYTNTATVYGKTGDDKTANNTATDTGGAIDYGSSAMVFTAQACKPGDTIVVGSAGENECPRFTGPVTAADAKTQIYITAVGGAQKATPMSTSDFSLSIDLKISCLPLNPAAPLSYAGLSFDCKGLDWQTVKARLPGGQPSAVLDNGSPLGPFSYADVGRISLSMRFKNSVMDTVNFISRPAEIRFRDVLRVPDGFADQKGTIDDGWAKPDIGFAKAGEQFAMRLGAVMADGKWAPSFGKEAAALGGILPAGSFGFVFKLDPFVVNQVGTARQPIPAKDQAVTDALRFDTGFSPVAASDTTLYESKASYFEAGLLAITPRLEDYLNSGQVPTGQPPNGAVPRMGSGTRIIGRFYPDHFVTVLTKNFDCAASMNCPLAAGAAVSGGAYSMQPFDFSITAYGLPKAPGGEFTRLYLYQNVTADGKTPGPLKLQASKSPSLVKAGTPADAQPPAVGNFPLVGGTPVDPATRLAPPTATAPFPEQKASVAYQLGDLYGNAARGSGAWGAPTPVYLRAVLAETRGGTPANTAVPISSMAPAGAQYEGGLMVVSGRLLVQNVFGSDLLRLPVPLTAQYWNGAGWIASAGDDYSVVASAILPVAGGCRKFFAQDLKTGACKANPLAIAGAVPILLNKGRGTMALQAPARGTIGSVDYTLDNGAANDWLPSTQARATFGLYRSPLIYLREVY